MKEVLSKYGERAVLGIQKSLDDKGLNASGKTRASIRYEASEKRLLVYGAANLEVLQAGAKPIRKKTTGLYISAMATWARTKLGLNDKEAKGLAFAMLRKRVGDGKGGRTTRADGSYFVPNEFNIGGVLSDTISKVFIGDLKSDILKKHALLIIAEINKVIK